MMKKNLAILGSTGSIGRNALKIVEMFPDRFRVRVLAGAANIELLAAQIEAFKPDLAVVIDEYHAGMLKEMVKPGSRVDVLYGDSGYEQAAACESVDQVVSAIVGAAGLLPTLSAISAGKDIALANKESLVMAGDIVMKAVRENGVRLLPVDSEHSAIFQSMCGNRRTDISKIYLTASGGPFLSRSIEQFHRIRPEDALLHPNWKMGPKISVDSATLMNKGLEVIEAKFLFDVSIEDIDVLIHPQSIIHSMVGYKDGSVIAQLGTPDMKAAIAYALSCPERLDIHQPAPDFAHISPLTFQKPDFEKFPCLGLALKACTEGHTMPAVMNAANETAVRAFLDHRIDFTCIPKVIQNTMDAHHVLQPPDLAHILSADRWARETAKSFIEECG
ncbi:MAG: 1-deoxy-D-xylulose-5-phosphate reductoisomerase [Desulfobacterales bacterium]